jgi:L-ascorbate 6-phosphate lactonase
MGLMATIQAARVAPATLALWFLGQNGWVVKSPQGFVLAVDPYLSDACHPSRRGLDLRRQVPLPLAPEELEADLVACTHSHRDHADPVTLAALAASGAASGAGSGRARRFLGPAETLAVFAAAGIAAADRTLFWPNAVTAAGDLTLTGTFALPTDTGDLTPLGLAVKAAGGPTVWITGDTAWCDLLAEDGARHRPDVVCVPINGGYANLSHWQAADLVHRVAARTAIPCHWDMFADNSCDPRMFHASLVVKGIGDAYHPLRAGEMLVVECATSRTAP